MLLVKNIVFGLVRRWPLALLLLLAACTKERSSEREIDNPNPNISNVPAIELIEVNPVNVVAYADSIVFSIQYTDGDGDLGTTNPDVPTVELIDNRNSDDLVFEYHLSPRSPAGTVISIQGELSIVLNNTILLDENQSSEQTTFSIHLQDRAGNWSNMVETETITITK